MKLSIRDQVILSAAIMLLLSLMLTLGAYVAGGEVRERAAALASEGVAVTGKITKKFERFGGVVNGPKYTWWLDLSYATTDGEVHKETVKVDKSTYDETAVGPVPVTYVRSRPGEFYIAGRNHYGTDDEILAAMSFYAAIVSVALFVALVALLLTRGGGGSPPARNREPSGPRVGIASRKQPGEFGVRQSRAR